MNEIPKAKTLSDLVAEATAKSASAKPLPTKPYAESSHAAALAAVSGNTATISGGAPTAASVEKPVYSHHPELLEWLRPVEDPEMFISIVELGLVYDTKLSEDGKKGSAVMTLTSPHCPVADLFVDNVRKRLLEYPGIVETDVKLTFEPKWDPKEMASDEVKDRLGIW